MTLFFTVGFLFGGFLVHANGEINISDNSVGGWGPKSFSQYYTCLWGSDHFSVNDDGSTVTLKYDNASGGAGFRSKLEFGYGVFSMRMKIPSGNTRGIVPNFYLTSAPDNQPPGNHFELDFEFLGTGGTVQTNVYDIDSAGGREQSFDLWFDPRADFHTYQFLWNPYHILFIIDGIPVREFKNNLEHGVSYPNVPMHIEASIWNADWAGDVDWSHAPFQTYYSGFSMYSCLPKGGDISVCGGEKYFWNGYKQLNEKQKQQMSSYRKKYMSYNYCWKPCTQKKECTLSDTLL